MIESRNIRIKSCISVVKSSIISLYCEFSFEITCLFVFSRTTLACKIEIYDLSMSISLLSSSSLASSHSLSSVLLLRELAKFIDLLRVIGGVGDLFVVL